MRRFLVLFTTLAACASLWTLPAAAAPSSCGVTWGSLDKSSANYSTATVGAVRSGRHDCFDRLVIDLSGPLAGYRVGYVDTVTMDGSGATVPLRGGAY
ncbi:AMIN-like domain-containing (lipo)protein, partial [Amycolatopsis sp. NPDC003676]